MTLSVRDSAALLDATCGAGPGDPYVVPGPQRPFLAEVGADPGRLRIGVLDRPGAEGFLDDPQCRDAVANAPMTSPCRIKGTASRARTPAFM